MAVVLVEGIEEGVSKTGNAFLKVDCVFSDKEKTKKQFYVWNQVSELCELYKARGGLLFLEIEFEREGNFPRIIDFEETSGEISEFYSFIYPNDEYARNLLSALVKSVKDEFLVNVINHVMETPLLDECGTKTVGEKFILCPGAKGIHHNYRYGLLRHTHEVMRFTSAICKDEMMSVFLDKPLCLAAALLHDVGKVYEYSFNGINSADYGETIEVNQIYLGSHLYKGAELVALAVQQIVQERNEPLTDVEQIRVEHLKHVILGHHLQREWASVPQKPATLEGYLVFLADYWSAQYGKVATLDFSNVTKQDLYRTTSKYEGFFGFSELIKKLQATQEENLKVPPEFIN